MLEMGDVECMLDDAAGNLKGYIVSLMEGMGLEESAIQGACDSHPVFEPVWGAALNSISSVIYLTAYCHYLDWRHHKYDKCKTIHISIQQPSGSESSTWPTNTSLSSGATTSSSDLTTCPSSSATSASSSAGLPSDVQPGHLAKKSKIQPEDEGSTKGKPKKKAKGTTKGDKGKGKAHQ